MRKAGVLLLLTATLVMWGMVCRAGATERGTWSDYQIQVDDEIYTFPMMYEEFVSFGWSSEETEGVRLDPYQYNTFYFTKGDEACLVYLLNLGVNTVDAENSIVAGIMIAQYNWPVENGNVELPGGLIRGEATEEDILAAYGTPTDIYEGKSYRQLSYEEAYNCELTVRIYNDSGVMEDITLEHFVEPEEYDPGEVSSEVPLAVFAYTKPERLSSDMRDYEIEIDGEIYTLPVPVSVLIEDGWMLDESNSDEQIVAGYYGWVTLRRNNLTIHEMVVNGEDYATIPENCWLETLNVGGYGMYADGALPGGVRIGTTEEELLALLDENGLDYEMQESGDFRYYEYNAPAYGKSCEVSVYIGSNSYYPKNTIVEVTCTNTLE